MRNIKITQEYARKKIIEGARGVNGNDLRDVLDNEGRINEKIAGSSLMRFIKDIALLFSFLKDYIKGNYRKPPWWVVTAVVFALLYILNPFDLVPDVIPVLGLADDLAVLTACLGMIRIDLNKYRNWRNQNIFRDCADGDIIDVEGKEV